MKYTPAQIKKALVSAAGFVVTVAVAGLGGHLFPSGWEPYIVAGIGIAASYGVFAARNAPVVTPARRVGDVEGAPPLAE